RFRDAPRLRRHALLQVIVRHRREQHGLVREVEGLIVPRQSIRASHPDIQGRLPSLKPFDAILHEIDTAQRCRLLTPHVAAIQQKPPFTETQVKNGAVSEGQHSARIEHASIRLLRTALDGRVVSIDVAGMITVEGPSPLVFDPDVGQHLLSPAI
ncbi:MAG: hypothetical protein O7B26_11745, partial [Planctomycetota bacterium]|nr:hypothetical protein [Planctomycetota bacterium]